jgi:hypothetical protein
VRGRDKSGEATRQRVEGGRSNHGITSQGWKIPAPQPHVLCGASAI